MPVNIEGVALTGGDSLFVWYLNGNTQNVDWSHPTLEQAVNGHNNYSEDVWTFWVIQNRFFVPHPMHLRGHDFSLLGQGSGTSNAPTDMELLKFENPTRRDVAMLVASGWTAIAFKTGSPGAWLMHRHIVFHTGECLSLQFLERPAKYGAEVNGQQFQDNCAAWREYESGPVAHTKSDSGLRRRSGQEDVVLHMNRHAQKRRAGH